MNEDRKVFERVIEQKDLEINNLEHKYDLCNGKVAEYMAKETIFRQNEAVYRDKEEIMTDRIKSLQKQLKTAKIKLYGIGGGLLVMAILYISK